MAPSSFLYHVQSLKTPHKQPYVDFYIWIHFITTLAAMTLDFEVLGISLSSLQTQPSATCSLQKQKFDHGTKKNCH